jgi:hypothetical protein
MIYLDNDIKATTLLVEEETKEIMESITEDETITEEETITDGVTKATEYDNMMGEIKAVAESISVTKTGGDGRIDSAMKEGPFLNQLRDVLLKSHPNWEIVISPPRASCDVMINSVRINLKLTDCKSCDNSVNKPSIYYSITGFSDYPYASNWNTFLDRLVIAKNENKIKQQRHKPTEYHYLVKNKQTGAVLMKPIFDIRTYHSNPSNDLQINWKDEFTCSEYFVGDTDYDAKVKSLLCCIQESVKKMIENTRRFAESDIDALFS